MAKQRTNNSSGNKLIVYEGPDGDTAQSDSYTNESQFLTERWSPGAVGTIHRFSDLDSAQIAQHHTLGPRHNQASPGDHKHDGTTSTAMGIWTPYTPTWTGTNATLSASIGNGTLSGSYTVINNTVFGKIILQAGSTTNFGASGTIWNFSRPPVDFGGGTNGGSGSAYAFNSTLFGAVTSPFSGAVGIDTPLSTGITIFGNGTAWDSTYPFTWGSSAYMIANFTYDF